MSEAVTIGTAQTGELAPLPTTIGIGLDVGALVGSHLGIVANSGGGKSGLLRKVLEATHGRIQHIILDSEDEFYTLRERFEYVIAGGEGGDAPAQPGNAADLARAALAHGFSLICQINDLGRDGAAEFVDNFLGAMISAPRELWRPCLIVIDEAQRYPAETLQQLTEAGRKRGFTAVIATQRLPKLDANVRGDINNWMMGRVGQALDKRHIADQLGMTPAQMRDALDLEVRHFWAFGPAISREPVLFRVGDVETTMVRPGQLRPVTPPPPEALREIMAGLKVPEPEADPERIAAMMAPPPEETAASCAEKAALRERIAELEAQIDEFTIERAVGQQQIDDLIVERDGLRAAIAAFSAAVGRVPVAVHDEPRLPLPAPKPAREVVVADPKPTRQAVVARDGASIPASQQRVLDAIAWWAAIGVKPVERNRAAVIAGLSPKASTFGVYVSKLAQAGLVDTTQPGSVALTPEGKAIANDPGKVDRSDVAKQARSMLKPAAANVLDHIVARYPEWIARGDLADLAGLSRTASTLGVYISESSKLGFVETKPGMVRAADWMMP